VGEMDMKIIIQSNLVVILTPYNYFDWNPKAPFQLKRKGLCNLTMATETEPTSVIEKMRWAKTPNKIWTTLEGLFGK
jgi:hypothetical protein